MQISQKDVKKIAALARLNIKDNDLESYQHHLQDVLNYVQKLNELDTDNVEPTYYVQEAKNVLREDEVKPSLSQEDALKNAPEESNGFFVVPKIISQDGG